MQFVFGDNKSRYDLLYTDGDRGEANKILDMIRLPYTSDPTYDTYGFVPFGTNFNRLLFFRCKRDTELSRGVYYLHGITHDIDKSEFVTQKYDELIFTNFMDQETYNIVRENAEGFSFTPGVNQALLSAQDNAPDIPMDALYAILIELYKKNRISVVIDDDKYSAELVLLLLRQIFSYLTPSLRKICSYIVALPDTGNAEFMLRILPANMYREDRSTCIHLFGYKGKSADTLTGFPALVYSRVLNLPPQKRENLFSMYETLYYGAESTYKKQTFEDFLQMIRAFLVMKEKGDRESRQACEEACEIVMDHVIGDNRFTPELKIPDIIAKLLAPLYADPAYLAEVIDQGKFDLTDPLAFYADNEIAFWKIYLFVNPAIESVKKMLQDQYNVCIDQTIHNAMSAGVARYRRNRPSDAQAKAVERQFCVLLDAELAKAERRLDIYEAECQKSCDRMQQEFRRYDKYMLNPQYHSQILSRVVTEELSREALKSIETQENLSFREEITAEGTKLMNIRVREVEQAKALADQENREREEAAYTEQLDQLNALIAKKEKALAAKSKKAPKKAKNKPNKKAKNPTAPTNQQPEVPETTPTYVENVNTDDLFITLIPVCQPMFHKKMAELIARDLWYKQEKFKETKVMFENKVAKSIESPELLYCVAEILLKKDCVVAMAYVDKYAKSVEVKVTLICTLLAEHAAQIEKQIKSAFRSWWKNFYKITEKILKLAAKTCTNNDTDEQSNTATTAETLEALLNKIPKKKFKKCNKFCSLLVELWKKYNSTPPEKVPTKKAKKG